MSIRYLYKDEEYTRDRKAIRNPMLCCVIGGINIVFVYDWERISCGFLFFVSCITRILPVIRRLLFAGSFFLVFYIDGLIFSFEKNSVWIFFLEFELI